MVIRVGHVTEEMMHQLATEYFESFHIRIKKCACVMEDIVACVADSMDMSCAKNFQLRKQVTRCSRLSR
jgi:hypothetical protein